MSMVPNPRVVSAQFARDMHTRTLFDSTTLPRYICMKLMSSLNQYHIVVAISSRSFSRSYNREGVSRLELILGLYLGMISFLTASARTAHLK